MRKGFTTGSCAAAASKAATYMLLSGKEKSEIKIETPAGIMFDAKIVDIERCSSYVSCAVVKDGGDDPDVTTGCHVVAKVSIKKESKENSAVPAVIEIDISETGIVPILEEGKLYYHPLTHSCIRLPIRQIQKKLEEAGADFTEDELKSFSNELKKQFVPEQNEKIETGETFVEGDKIVLVYHPDEAFLTLLEEKELTLKFDDCIYVVTADETGEKLRFVPVTP